MIIEGIICRCCFEDEQRILNSDLESLLPLGTEAVCLTLNSFVISAAECGCGVLDHGCAAWPEPEIRNTEVPPSKSVNLRLTLPADSFVHTH